MELEKNNDESFPVDVFSEASTINSNELGPQLFTVRHVTEDGSLTIGDQLKSMRCRTLKDIASIFVKISHLVNQIRTRYLHNATYIHFNHACSTEYH